MRLPVAANRKLKFAARSLLHERVKMPGRSETSVMKYVIMTSDLLRVI